MEKFNFWQLAVIAATVEVLIQIWKTVKQKGTPLNGWQLVAMTLGIVICLGGGFDFFAAAGVPLTFAWLAKWADPELLTTIGSVIGMILSGMLASRGASLLFDLYEIVQKIKGGEKPVIPTPPAQ